MTKIESEDGYYYDVPEDAESLINISDVGESAAIKLYEEGYRELSDFVGKNPKKLATETGITKFTAIRIVSQADKKQFDPEVYKNNRSDQA